MSRYRRFLLFVIVGLVVLGVVAACAGGPVSQPQVSQPASSAASGPVFLTVPPREAKAIIDKNRGNPNFVILDVRTPEEFQSGHIKGAINIDFYAPDFAQKLDKLDKGKVYVVYCRSGHRSAQAVSLMKQQGFQTVYEIEGGIRAWQAGGFPLVR